LDDEGLKNTSHYPYELAHYKNQMLFRIAFDSQKSEYVKESKELVHARSNI